MSEPTKFWYPDLTADGLVGWVTVNNDPYNILSAPDLLCETEAEAREAAEQMMRDLNLGEEYPDDATEIESVLDSVSLGGSVEDGVEKLLHLAKKPPRKDATAVALMELVRLAMKHSDGIMFDKRLDEESPCVTWWDVHGGAVAALLDVPTPDHAVDELEAELEEPEERDWEEDAA